MEYKTKAILNAHYDVKLNNNSAIFELGLIKDDYKWLVFPRKTVGVYISVKSPNKIEYSVSDGFNIISSGSQLSSCFGGTSVNTNHSIEFYTKDISEFRVFFSDKPMRDLFFESYQYKEYEQKLAAEKMLHENDIDDEVITITVGRLLYNKLQYEVEKYCFANDVKCEVLSNKGLLTGQFCFKLNGKKKHIDTIRNYFRSGCV